MCSPPSEVRTGPSTSAPRSSPALTPSAEEHRTAAPPRSTPDPAPKTSARVGPQQSPAESVPRGCTAIAFAARDCPRYPCFSDLDPHSARLVDRIGHWAFRKGPRITSSHLHVAHRLRQGPPREPRSSRAPNAPVFPCPVFTCPVSPRRWAARPATACTPTCTTTTGAGTRWWTAPCTSPAGGSLATRWEPRSTPWEPVSKGPLVRA